MKVSKNELSGALIALGKLICRTASVEAYKSVMISAHENELILSTISAEEKLSVTLSADGADGFQKIVNYAELKELVKGSSEGNVFFQEEHGVFTARIESGRKISTHALVSMKTEWNDPVIEPEDAPSVTLPDGFVELLEKAAPLINRRDYRPLLQGINLSSNGITATNGKELLNIPLALPIDGFTIPFPLALMATREKCGGLLKVWRDKSVSMFSIQVGAWTWYGKALDGEYPDWHRVIPSEESHLYKITIENESADMISAFLKRTAGELFKLTPSDAETLIISGITENEDSLVVPSNITGHFQERSLILTRSVMERLLMLGHRTITVSDGYAPIAATGGTGQLIAMQIHQKPEETSHPEKKEEKMNQNETNVVSASAQTAASNNQPEAVAITVTPLDELNSSIEDFKQKLKIAFEEASILSRKVREIALFQKQKERDFVQARRALERVRMAI